MTVCTPTHDGTPYIQWINNIFGDCVYGKQDAISLLLGYCSIFIWINAQLPQLIRNYKSGSADCLSVNFLSMWLAGDSANLIGALLTHQLSFQIYLGTYFVIIDVCVLCQWIYYNKIKSPKQHNEYLILPSEDNIKVPVPENDLFQHPAHIPVNIQNSPAVDELTPFSSSASPSKWYTLAESTKTKTMLSMLLFTTTMFTNNSQQQLTTFNTNTDSTLFELNQDNAIWVGRIFAWGCTCLYLTSRIPQLVKNYRRKSVEGLSGALFLCAVGGNLTYAASILSHPGQTKESLLEALPYLLGSAGTLIFDFSIFCQFCYYQKKPVHLNKTNIV